MSNAEKIVIRTVGKPRDEGVDDLYGWFCEVFDLSGKGREMEPQILKEIVGSSMAGKGVTSLSLYKKLSVPRSTVIYHLNRFISMGLVVRKGRRYYLRSGDMESTLQELQEDVLREFNRMIEFAEMLDKSIEDVFYGRKGKRYQER